MDDKESRPAALRRGSGQGSGHRILIVDDDESIRRSLRLIFERKGYETETAGTGREAIEQARGRFFNLVLLDIRLPDVEGLELLAPLKGMYPDIALIIITGYASLESAVRALNEGASAYIIKPLNMDEVLAAVREVLEKQRLVIENRRLIQEAQRELAERKRADEALRESEKRFRSIAETASDAIIIFDSHENIIFWNPAAKTIFGYLPGETRDKLLASIMPERFREVFRREMKQVITAGESDLIGKAIEVAGVRKDGSEFPLELSLATWRTRGETFFTAIARDITERKRAEEELKELLKKIERAKQEWESTVDSLSELICLVDDGGHVIRANRIVETWNLARVTDVKGRGVHELLHPSCADSSCYLDPFWKQAWEAAMRGQPVQCEAYDEVLKRHVLVQVQPWKDWGKGKALGSTVVVVRDITERKRMEEELRKTYSDLRESQAKLIQSERLAVIGQLAAGVGHELRNPLSIIKNCAYYLDMKLRDPDGRAKKHIKIMEMEIASSNKIINNLLSFAQDEKPTLRKTQINTVLQDALSRSAVPDSVVVVTELGEALPPLRADPGQIEQVFMNMISNALQAVSDGGRLEFVTRAEEGFIVTEFKDNGCGIPEENLEKIFEPLFTTKAKGIGLGLAVSKQLIQAHKGAIEVESEVGKGTTFSVRLPIQGG